MFFCKLKFVLSLLLITRVLCCSSFGSDAENHNRKRSFEDAGFSGKSSLTAKKIKTEENNIDVLIKKANQGDVESQFILARSYFKGEGVERNMEKAFEWYSKAAEQGDFRAQGNLANCYSKGKGVERNMEKAFEWYSKAAEQGDARAQNILGNCYLKGEGVERNIEKAFEWYSKAAEQGDVIAE
ncbi:MAG: tetratricopeptide repeat protein [Janthinobacterium lividum]